jgi:hypothetical protein
VTRFNAFDGGSTEGVAMNYRNEAAGSAVVFALRCWFGAAADAGFGASW